MHVLNIIMEFHLRYFVHPRIQQSTIIRRSEKDYMYVNSDSIIVKQNENAFFQSDIENYKNIKVRDYKEIRGKVFFDLNISSNKLSFRNLIEWFLRVVRYP